MFGQTSSRLQEWRDGKWERKKLSHEDLTEAHLNGKSDDGEAVYIAFTEGWCGAGKFLNLKRWLCGRSSANAWEQDYFEELGEFGMGKGVFAPTVFHGVERGIRCVVHGDDSAFLG